jgi:hypothetical protein
MTASDEEQPNDAKGPALDEADTEVDVARGAHQLELSDLDPSSAVMRALKALTEAHRRDPRPKPRRERGA